MRSLGAIPLTIGFIITVTVIALVHNNMVFRVAKHSPQTSEASHHGSYPHGIITSLLIGAVLLVYLFQLSRTAR